MERTDTPELEKTGPAGTWLVIIGVTGKYIVRTLKTIEEVRAIHDRNGRLDTEDCFEFISNLQVRPAMDPRTQQPMGLNFSKQTIACRIDATLFPMPLALSLFGAALYFLDDLKEGDAMAYKDIIRDAVRLGDDMHKQRVEALTGIKAAQASAIPQVGLPFVR